MSLTDVGCKGKIIGKGNRCQLPKAKAKGLSALVHREFLASSGLSPKSLIGELFVTSVPPRRAEAALYPNYTVMFMGLSRKGGLKLMKGRVPRSGNPQLDRILDELQKKLEPRSGVSAMTNLTTPANQDADTITVAELADIVGNLIVKLRAAGYVRD